MSDQAIHVGGHATTDQVTEAVLRHLSWSRWSTDTEEETVGAEWESEHLAHAAGVGPVS